MLLDAGANPNDGDSHLAVSTMGLESLELMNKPWVLPPLSNSWIVFIIWVVVNIRVRFWVLIIIRHLIFRVPKKGS